MASVVCVVVRPSPIFREGLTSILAKSPFKPVWSSSTTEEVPSKIARVGEQVLVLMDIPNNDTVVEALSAAKAMFPGPPIVVVGDSTKRDLVTTALVGGATSFIDENVAASTLIKELELIAKGESIISVEIFKRLLGDGAARPYEQGAPTPKLDGEESPDGPDEVQRSVQLSRREAAILNALVQGASNKVIAYRLNITEATVKVHVKGILRKIQVKNRTQAAIWALHHQALPRSEHREVALVNLGSPTRTLA